jgi:acyl-CoA synthetase (AMP-forming)/AMP-acid ligase II
LFAGAIRERIAELRAIARILPNLRRASPGAHWNAARLLAERAAADPTAHALIHGERRFTWDELDRAVTRHARGLARLGVGPGDVVALLMDNRPEYLILLSALARLRAVAALLNTNVSGPALVHAFRAGRATFAIVGSEHADGLAEVLPELPFDSAGRVVVHRDPEGPAAAVGFPSLDEQAAAESELPFSREGTPRPEDPSCYVYTSGTTGLPKAAVITNGRFLAAGAFFGAGIMELGREDVVYVPLPLYHSNALFAGWSAALTTGAALAIRRRFSASAFWDDVRASDASVFVYIGELCRYLLCQPSHADERRHRLRLATGNGLRPDIWTRFQERFGVPLVREFYGATEGNVVMVNVSGRPGMVGRLNPGQEIVRCDLETGALERTADGRCQRVHPGETGLLLGRISLLAPYEGYVDPQATDKKIVTGVFKEGDRYFNTGDLMTLHEDGWASFADRLGDTFRWKGENVSTMEVAAVLSAATGVLESNVYGVEVPGGEGRPAMASLRTDESFSLDGFASWVRDRLPPYQRPYFLRLLEEMRVTSTFKQQKVEYRNEGYDPARISDPLYFLEGDHYVALDRDRFEAIRSGRLALR